MGVKERVGVGDGESCGCDLGWVDIRIDRVVSVLVGVFHGGLVTARDLVANHIGSHRYVSCFPFPCLGGLVEHSEGRDEDCVVWSGELFVGSGGEDLDGDGSLIEALGRVV